MRNIRRSILSVNVKSYKWKWFIHKTDKLIYIIHFQKADIKQQRSCRLQVFPRWAQLELRCPPLCWEAAMLFTNTISLLCLIQSTYTRGQISNSSSLTINKISFLWTFEQCRRKWQYCCGCRQNGSSSSIPPWLWCYIQPPLVICCVCISCNVHFSFF